MKRTPRSEPDQAMKSGEYLSAESMFLEHADPFPFWPNCTTPDCGHKQCLWSGLPLCHPCGVRAVGLPEMIARYNATHDITWEECERDGFQPSEEEGDCCAGDETLWNLDDPINPENS